VFWQGGVYPPFQRNRQGDETPPYTLPGRGAARLCFGREGFIRHFRGIGKAMKPLPTPSQGGNRTILRSANVDIVTNIFRQPD